MEIETFDDRLEIVQDKQPVIIVRPEYLQALEAVAEAVAEMMDDLVTPYSEYGACRCCGTKSSRNKHGLFCSWKQSREALAALDAVKGTKE